MALNVIVVGGGKVGAHLSAILLAGKHHVKIIEQDRNRCEQLRTELPHDAVVFGSGTDPDLLEKCGIRNAEVLAAVAGTDETNLVASSLAKFEFGVPRVIARVNHPKNAWMFTPRMAVDVALNQADLMAHLIAEEMSVGDIVTLLKLRKGQYSLVEEKVAPDAIAAGKCVRELELPKNCVLAAVIRGGQLIVPRGDTVLKAADEVLAVVHAEQLAQLAAVLGRR